MKIIKCPACGGDFVVTDENSVNVCVYCGARLCDDEEILPSEKAVVEEAVAVEHDTENSKVEKLLELAFLFLADGDWADADEYCEKALDIFPECAEGYLGKLMVDLEVRNIDELKDCAYSFEENRNYQNALHYADDSLKSKLLECAVPFASAGTYTGDTPAEDAKKDMILADAEKKMLDNNLKGYRAAIKLLETIPGWKNAEEKKLECQEKIKELKKKKEIDRKKTEEDIKTTREIFAIAAITIVVAFAVCSVIIKTVIPNIKYRKAIDLLDEGNVVAAYDILISIEDYRQSKARAMELSDNHIEVFYDYGIEQYEAGQYVDAATYLAIAGDYKDAAEMVLAAKYAYVSEHKDPTDITTYQYSGELKAVGYKDSASLYEELFAWKFEIVYCNTDRDDEFTKLSSIPNESDFLHIGFKFTGGEPEKVLTLSHGVIWPGESEEKADWEWSDIKSGDEFAFHYPTGRGCPEEGMLTIRFYDAANDNFMGAISIPVRGVPDGNLPEEGQSLH